MLSLYGAHFFRVALPIAVVPFLARVLGANGWGLYALGTALAVYVSLLVEFGFGLSATREISRSRCGRKARSRTFTDVVFAQLALSLFGALGQSGSLVRADARRPVARSGRSRDPGQARRAPRESPGGVVSGRSR